jgi:predicted DNA-binding transcriptional regulator YafY
MTYGAKERLIDVIRFDGMYIRAFCHLKKEELTFRLDRVEGAELVASSTPLFE